MPIRKPVAVLVTYVPKAGNEDALLQLVRQHWPTLRRLDLVSATPVQVWRATDKDTRRVTFVELFEWADDTSSGIAHQTPEVMAVWEPMGPLLDTMKVQMLQKV